MYLATKIFWTLIELIFFPFTLVAKKFNLYNWKVYEYVILLNMLWMVMLFLTIVSYTMYLIVCSVK